MEKYIQEQKRKIGLRIKEIISSLELEPYQFANLTNLTVNTIINIEAGKGFNSNTILTISFYTGMPLNLLLDISSNKIKENLLRKTFWRNVEKYNYSKYKEYKSKPFTITEAIKELIKETSFFKSPKKTSDVLSRLEKDYSVKLNSSAVSQALLSFAKEGILKKDKLGARNNHYYK